MYKVQYTFGVGDAVAAVLVEVQQDPPKDVQLKLEALMDEMRKILEKK